MENAIGAAQSHVARPPAPATPGGVRTYEELEGGQGRVHSFRPHRFAAHDFAPLQCTVALDAGEVTHECPARDISQNGVAFIPAIAFSGWLGQPIQLSVRLDGHPIWSGRARVSSVRVQDGKTVVGASFGSALLEADELRRLRELWIPGTAAMRLENQPWRTPGAYEFKSVVAELGLYLRSIEDELRALEASLPWSAAESYLSVSRTTLVERLRADISTDIIRLFTDAGMAASNIDPEESHAIREFSIRQIHGLLMQAPWLRRAREKPLGYAGDYEVMNYLYERQFEGPTLFARTVGYACMQTAAARAVRSRKDLMKRVLRSVLERSTGSSRAVRILSIASGPARELQELFLEMQELPVELEVVLFDQDLSALEHAFHRLRPLTDARFPGRVHIEFLNESIKRLLRDNHLFEGLERFDAVYSCGLFDYLHEVTAVRLARNLCAAAAPGGLLLIGNMADHPHRWIMEYHLEWELLYRTRQQLVDIGHRASRNASVRLLEEESGVNPFIEVVPA
ncbi:MAG TPA: class I SAM-dependent methyltransferase [Anaeromyxobacteraceae bacterium]|nr:class I SAM-dependent methyltransferase [Anaeromyxobacteraceae bacterium]